MSSVGAQARYVLDTSALLDWHDRYYPPDVFASLVGLLDGLIAEGRLMSVQLVLEEVGAMGSRSLGQWAEGRKGMFAATENHLAQALSIKDAYPALSDPHAQFEEADAYVIGYAESLGATVVTAETPAATKRKTRRSMYIPDVCAALGVPCIANLGMMRKEGWRI